MYLLLLCVIQACGCADQVCVTIVKQCLEVTEEAVRALDCRSSTVSFPAPTAGSLLAAIVSTHDDTSRSRIWNSCRDSGLQAQTPCRVYMAVA